MNNEFVVDLLTAEVFLVWLMDLLPLIDKATILALTAFLVRCGFWIVFKSADGDRDLESDFDFSFNCGEADLFLWCSAYFFSLLKWLSQREALPF